MSRWAAVHQPDSMIWEIRYADSVPEFVPSECVWFDATDWGFEDRELVCTAATFDGTTLTVPPQPRPA
jgi:hypothetical protein